MGVSVLRLEPGLGLPVSALAGGRIKVGPVGIRNPPGPRISAGHNDWVYANTALYCSLADSPWYAAANKHVYLRIT